MEREKDLAVLFLMGGRGRTREAASEISLLSQVWLQEEEKAVWTLEPGRNHLPAEFGGRIAKEETSWRVSTETIPSGNERIENLARMCPLGFDANQNAYTGTVLWG